MSLEKFKKYYYKEKVSQKFSGPYSDPDLVAIWAYQQGLLRAKEIAENYGKETFNIYEPKDIAKLIEAEIEECNEKS